MDRGRLSKGNALPIDALDEAINEAHLEQAHFTLAETPFRTANEAEFYAEPPEQEQPSPPRSLTGEPLAIDRKIQLAFANSAARSFLLQNKQVNNLNQQLARQRDQLGRQNLLIQKLQASLHEATMTKAHSRSQVKPPPSWKPRQPLGPYGCTVLTMAEALHRGPMPMPGRCDGARVRLLARASSV